MAMPPRVFGEFPCIDCGEPVVISHSDHSGRCRRCLVNHWRHTHPEQMRAINARNNAAKALKRRAAR